jgi:hypothetical protein
METITFKNSLKKSHVLGTVKCKLTEEIVKIGNYPELKCNQELTLHCCRVIEYLIEKYAKIDKKQLILDVLNQIYSFDEAETQNIRNQIEFFFERNMIKLPKLSKKLFSFGYKWLSKKLL